MGDNTGVHVIVSGRVQGVGYRVFVLEQAQELGLVGWVRNLPNGDVEAEAQGDRPSLDTWLAALKEGPTLSRVDAIQTDWRPMIRPPSRFEIR